MCCNFRGVKSQMEEESGGRSVTLAQRVAAISALRQQDHILRKPMAPEQITTHHHQTLHGPSPDPTAC